MCPLEILWGFLITEHSTFLNPDYTIINFSSEKLKLLLYNSVLSTGLMVIQVWNNKNWTKSFFRSL